MQKVNIDRSSLNLLYSEDIISVLRDMISDELSKPDEKVNTEFVDECVNALLEIEQDRDKTFAVFIPLISGEEYLSAISGKKRYFKKLNRFTRAALIAAIAAASSITVNAAVEGVTGVNLLKEAGVRIQQTIDKFSGGGIDHDYDDFDEFERTLTSTTTETATSEEESITESESETETTVSQPAQTNTSQSASTESTTHQGTTKPEESEENPTQESTTKAKPDRNTTTSVEPDIVEPDTPTKPEKVTLKSLEASFNSFKFDYIYGEKLTYDGLTLKAVYSNGVKKPVALSDCDYTSSLNMNTTADYTLRVIYETCVVKIPITIRPDEETRGSEKRSNEDFDYLLTERGAYITKYKGNKKDLNLNDIDGNKVYAVAAGVFENSEIESVNAPEVKKVFRAAFKNAKSLKTASLPKAEYIGDSAFEGCEVLEAASMSENAKELGKSVYKNSGIKSITLPSQLKTAPASLCEGCTALESVDLGGAEKVESSAFEDCTKLTEIVGMGAVKEIGSFAFYGDELAEIDEAPSKLEKIGDSGLAYCKKMAIRTLPRTVKEIGEYSFMYVTRMESAEINKAITVIPAGAFQGTHLKTLYLYDGLKAIEQAAFMSTVIKEVTIPETVERIESRGLYSLTRMSVAFEGDTEIDPDAFFNYSYLSFKVKRDTKPEEFAIMHDIDYEITD